MYAGYRTAKVFNEVTEEVNISKSGNMYLIEVTNDGEEDAEVTFNEFIEQGHEGFTLKVKAGTTRKVPVQTYKVKSTLPVDIIAYGR